MNSVFSIPLKIVDFGGEVLTIATSGSIDIRSFEDRQAYMLEKFGFACDCRACVERWPAAEIMRDQFLYSGFQVKCIECGIVVRSTAISCSKCGTKIGITVKVLSDAYDRLTEFMKDGCCATKPPGNLQSVMPSIRIIAALGLDPFFPKMYSQAVVSKWAQLFGNKSP